MTVLPSPSEFNSRPSRAPVDERVQRQLATYWRVRVSKTIERLEHEARRMLQLEEEIAAFAAEYYAAVGESAARLARMEEQLRTKIPADATIPEFEEVLAYRDGQAARKLELKARYRSIAKEIHPDRAMIVDGAGTGSGQMHALNTAYQHGDLAALLKLEAQLQLTKLCDIDFSATAALESALHDVNRAADTYAQGYRTLLNSPLNELMLRAMTAHMEGWDFMQAVIQRIERTIDEKEHELALLNVMTLSSVWQPEGQAA